ncbi:MAG TPA: hypothetical protein VGP62_15635 [Bryobacteraceae bacterium]|jgi:hypothetical protein|nr:hypothetical protein [Bryobacteraceae bacterium]
MNSKILIAFIAGAVIASGIVYMAVKEEASPKAAAVSSDVPRPAPPPAALPVAVTAPATPAPLPLTPTPHREKPSPMPPPVSRERPVTTARIQDPPPRPESPARAPLAPVEAQIPSEPAQAPPAPASVAPQATAPPEDAPSAQPAPEVRTPHTVTIAAGTVLPVRIGETISTAHFQAGDSFFATLDRPLVVDGWIIAEKGSRLEGRVVEAEPGGRGNSASRLRIELVKLSTADGQHVQIRTDPYKKDAGSSAGSDAAKVGVGAVLGAAIGAAAGGGKGAAIGGGAGAAAGVAGVVLTRGKLAEIPVESRISFRMANQVIITERLN